MQVRWKLVEFYRHVTSLLGLLLHDLAGGEPWLDVNEDRHLLLLLSAIQLIYASYNLGYDVARPEIKKLASQVLNTLKKKPPPIALKTFFGV